MARLKLIGVSSLLVSSFALGQNPGIPDFSTVHSDAIDNVKITDAGILISLPIRKKSALLPMSLALQTNVGVIGGYNANQGVDGILVSQTQFTTPSHFYPAINGSSGLKVCGAASQT